MPGSRRGRPGVGDHLDELRDRGDVELPHLAFQVAGHQPGHPGRAPARVARCRPGLPTVAILMCSWRFGNPGDPRGSLGRSLGEQLAQLLDADAGGLAEDAIGGAMSSVHWAGSTRKPSSLTATLWPAQVAGGIVSTSLGGSSGTAGAGPGP